MDRYKNEYIKTALYQESTDRPMYPQYRSGPYFILELGERYVDPGTKEKVP